jgi:hypothetical protein
MVKAVLEKEEEETYLAPQISSNEEDILKLLEKLEADEAFLTEQKERFSSLLMQLEIRGKEAIVNKKRVIEKLNLEVSDLKNKCEKLLTFINAESALECKQAGV